MVSRGTDWEDGAGNEGRAVQREATGDSAGSGQWLLVTGSLRLGPWGVGCSSFVGDLHVQWHGAALS
ncbi:hypothetical protein GUJ93_ZPchr0007g5430 [Zizania palustris]|uniref:Uncharacterized protein n=1 Tax=Zizania palustris TaxID=103762 RepID=A0A8J5TFY8_ZIZPA|nr:hypothetical protein GUJ93_ZPchr0007g5430 [Zizania palustris]